MKHAHTPLRPGMTALAAALALTATPLFAQAADPAPVMVSPPAPVVTAPAATVAAPAASVNATPAAVTPAPSLATPTMAPIVHQPEESVAPVVERAARTPRAITPRATAATRAPVAIERATQTPAPVEPAAPALADRPPVATPAPVARAAPAPVPQPAQQTAETDVLPIAGGVGAALLLLGGAVALGRRRRRDDADEAVIYETQPEMLVEPMPVAAPFVPVAAPAVATDTATTLPSGFDISRFGRHTQAAYRGPTPENPSVSLKKRLKIASFYDGRERMASEGRAAPLAAAPPPAPVPAAAARRTDHITVQAAKVRPNFKPAFSS